MATTKSTRVTHRSRSQSFGLLASGRCGPWEIAIDETTSGTDRFFAEIEGPSVGFYFEIPSVDIVGKMARFLQPRSAATSRPPVASAEPNGSLVIGKDKKTPITLVRDDEYDDRFFLVVGPMDNPVVRFVIAGTDVTNIAKALEQVKEDLDDEN
jgi:hypothetical protein